MIFLRKITFNIVLVNPLIKNVKFDRFNSIYREV